MNLPAPVLLKNGIEAERTPDNRLEIQSREVIAHPENVATLLVRNNVPPAMLNVVEEDLESYFLRTIKMKGEEQ